MMGRRYLMVEYKLTAAYSEKTSIPQGTVTNTPVWLEPLSLTA
jgi:hypothetical protein